MKLLSELLSNETLSQNSDLNYKKLLVSDICDDSRKASDSSLFVAINGNKIDGKKYIDDAILNGAKYIVFESIESEIESQHCDVFFIKTKNARKELAHIASRFFESNLDNIVAVTGTNGKSSTVDITRQIWTYANRKAISVGTLGIIYSDGHVKKLSGTLTCPPSIELHKIFNSLSKYDSAKFSAAIEASSHGIIQHRLDYIPFSVCAFTNFTQDHLDYHKTMEQYWQAKERLFFELANNNTKFVINADDPKSENIKSIAKERNISCVDYGYNAKDIKIIDIKAEQTHQFVSALFFGKKISFYLPLFGKFQVYNSLCAAANCYFTGVKLETIIEAFEKLQPINGRLELITNFNSANIYVDYAHTPDALQNSILSLREHKPKRIITVFGCGGERDHQKRKIMGKVAENLSDIVIVTDDNPRQESPKEIRKMIMEGCPNALEIGNRKNAIESAIDMLQDGDALLIAGKGHENYQQIGKDFIHFSDKEVVLNKVSK